MFFRCSAWREYGENVAQSLTKGMRVVVTGRLQIRSYEYNGERRTSAEIQVDEVGPSLRYATAKVEKTTRGGGGGGNYGGQGFGNAGGGRQGSVSYDAPTGGSQNDEWSSPSTFNNAPPF